MIIIADRYLATLYALPRRAIWSLLRLHWTACRYSISEIQPVTIQPALVNALTHNFWFTALQSELAAFIIGCYWPIATCGSFPGSVKHYVGSITSYLAVSKIRAAFLNGLPTFDSNHVVNKSHILIIINKKSSVWQMLIRLLPCTAYSE